jgi:hypothetical protein
MATVGALAQVWRYPVKSMGGEVVPSVELGTAGIPDDRRWALRNLDTGKILSAKLPKPGRVLLSLGAVLEPDGSVVVQGESGEVIGTAGTEQLDAALGERLGLPVRLERAAGDDDDEVYESWWPDEEGVLLAGAETDLPMAMSTEKVSFVDLAGLHLLTTGSLAQLAAGLPESQVPVERFRPSLLIDTEDGWVEDGWQDRTATLGGARLSITSAAPRCVMPTLAQSGLPDDKRVLQHLAAEHRLEFAGLGEVACLGVYAEVLEPGPIVVGDPLVLDPPT